MWWNVDNNYGSNEIYDKDEIWSAFYQTSIENHDSLIDTLNEILELKFKYHENGN